MAAYMAGVGQRDTSFFPAIKCSNCGNEIEIAAMGEHICGPAISEPEALNDYSSMMSNPYALSPASPPQAHAVPLPPMSAIHMPPMPSIPPMPEMPPMSSVPPMPPMPSMPTMPDPMDYQQPYTTSPARDRAPTLSSNPDTGMRMPRAPLPRINAEAANQPFTGSKHDSPMSPTLSVRSTKGKGAREAMTKSVKSRMPRLYDPDPPSPELSVNIDCAFPPFPAPAGYINQSATSNGRKTPSNRGPSRSASRPDHGLMPGQSAYDLEPKSPRLNAGENVMQRLNNLKSGPFNASKTKSSSGDSRPGPFSFGNRRPSEPTTNNTDTPPLRTDFSATNTSDPEIPFPEMSPPLLRPERPTTEEVFSPRFLDQFSAEPGVVSSPVSSPLRPSNSPHELERSQTYPLPDERPFENAAPKPLTKVNSEPSLPNLGAEPFRSIPAMSETSRMALPGPSSSTTGGEDGARFDFRMQDAPPVPRPLQRHRQESFTTPSESGYSTVSSSASHSNSHSSRRPSPVTSAASSFDTFSPVNYDAHRYGEDEHTRLPDSSFKSFDRFSPVEEEGPAMSPSQTFAHPVPPRTDSVSDRPPPVPLESPMDPALQSRAGISRIEPLESTLAMGALPPRTDSVSHATRRGPVPAAPPLTIPNAEFPFPTYRPVNWQPGGASNDNGYVSPQRGLNNASPVPRVQSPNTMRSPATPIDPQMRPGSRRGTSAKAMCRGCGQLIEGKSVKAADGRLTGRWHKACFVCRACREPFTTADFYVINNEPYCEQHYHEHNGSLCVGCNRGIEGQYIETTSTGRPGAVDRKFHPRCFTCWECRSVLSDDYFEIDGKVFCERHALAAMRAQARLGGGGGSGGNVGGGVGPSGLIPPNSRSMTAERRTTRLMMMA